MDSTGGGLRGGQCFVLRGATGYNFALTCPNIPKNCSARLFKSLQREMMQYYAITLPRQVSKKVLRGGNLLRGGQLFGGGNDFALQGGQGGLREILNFENRFFECHFFEF